MEKVTFETMPMAIQELRDDVKEVKHLLKVLLEDKQNIDMPIDVFGAMKITGYERATIYSKCSRNEMPHYRQQGRLYFFAEELIEWIKTGKRKTIKEIEEEVDELLSKK